MVDTSDCERKLSAQKAPPATRMRVGDHEESLDSDENIAGAAMFSGSPTVLSGDGRLVRLDDGV